MTSDSFFDSVSHYSAVGLLVIPLLVHTTYHYRLLKHLKFLVSLALVGGVLCVLNHYGVFVVVKDLYDLASRQDTSLRSASGIAKLCREIQALAEARKGEVLLFLSLLYLLLQSLCIPGTVALNAVIGALSGTMLGVVHCTLLGTLGAACCYGLSYTVGTGLVETADRRLMKGEGLTKIRTQVTRYRKDLLVYLLFLRLTPILPNWLVNLASPVVGVPLSTFVLATAAGIIPQTYLSVRFGAAVKVGENGSMVTVWDTLLVALIGATVLLVYRLRKRFTTE